MDEELYNKGIELKDNKKYSEALKWWIFLLLIMLVSLMLLF